MARPRRNIPVGGPAIPNTPTGPIIQLQVPMPQLGAYKPSPSTFEGSQVIISQGKNNMGILQPHGGMNLGPLGYNPNELIILLQIDIQSFLTFQAVMRQINQNITESDILNAVISDIYIPLKVFMYNMIRGASAVVPIDSGRLANAMELSIAGGKGSGAQGGATSLITGLNPFMVILNTGMVSYAPVVNQMSPDMLKHYGASHQGKLSQRFGRTVTQKQSIQGLGHRLFDPTAEQHWFEKVRDGGRQFAQQRWNNAQFGGNLFNLATKIVAAYSYLNPHPPGTPNVSPYTEQQIIPLLLGVRFG